MDKREIARGLVRRMMGERFLKAIEAKADSQEFGAEISRRALEFAFADTWARAGLDLKTRSLITLSILLAQRQAAEFKNHARFALNNGVTAKDLEELLIQAIPYAGFPAVSVAQTAAIEALREAGVESDKLRTAEERGLTG